MDVMYQSYILSSWSCPLPLTLQVCLCCLCCFYTIFISKIVGTFLSLSHYLYQQDSGYVPVPFRAIFVIEIAGMLPLLLWSPFFAIIIWLRFSKLIYVSSEGHLHWSNMSRCLLWYLCAFQGLAFSCCHFDSKAKCLWHLSLWLKTKGLMPWYPFQSIITPF